MDALDDLFDDEQEAERALGIATAAAYLAAGGHFAYVNNYSTTPKDPELFKKCREQVLAEARIEEN